MPAPTRFGGETAAGDRSLQAAPTTPGPSVDLGPLSDVPGLQFLVELVQVRFVQAAFVLAVGLVLGVVVGRFSKRLLQAVNTPALVEGTAFERSAQSLGLSTVTIVAGMASWFVYAVSVLAALNVSGLLTTVQFWQRFAGFIPQLFVAALVVVVGFVVADKAELLVGERLRGVKLPEVTVVPKLVKYSVLYVVFLIALSQIGVETLALVALLSVYAIGIIALAAVALRDFLSSGAAGIYLLMRQPYGIGDRVEIGDRSGVVQGMDILVTRVENDTEEYIIPNSEVLEHGVVRVRGE
jgi:small-conductance mechanosensitive channel